MIGGKTQLALQTKTTIENEIGEKVPTWTTVQTLTGWLDYQAGESKHTTFNAKIQESTHFFICDYAAVDVEAEECRAVCNGKMYDVLLIDNPMEMDRQIEIYLRFTGGQNG